MGNFFQKNMQRRIFLKETVLGTTGFILLHACGDIATGEYYIGKKISITKAEQEKLKMLVASIIPADKNKGSADLDLHHFVLKMVDDCFARPDQDRFLQGLRLFEKEAVLIEKQFFKVKDFAAQAACIKKIMANNGIDESVHYFLQTTKAFTIKGYLQSEYVMTTLLPYKMTPGPFKGCIKV